LASDAIEQVVGDFLHAVRSFCMPAGVNISAMRPRTREWAGLICEDDLAA
jgi:hypothetical protein